MAIATDLDHVGVGVRDLGAAALAYQRLGFTLSPFAQHSGAIEPGGPTVKKSTGNRCAMLNDGYIELISVVDKTLPGSGLERLLEIREGIHIIAIGCEDANSADAALKKAGFGAKGSVYLERMSGTADGPKLARFDRVPVGPNEMPEAAVFYIKHLTRDVIWQPHLMKHANGAIELAEVFVHVSDFAEGKARYGRFLDATPAKTGAGFATFDLPRGKLTVGDTAGLKSLLPAVNIMAAPAPVGIVVRTSSLDLARKTAIGSGATPIEHDGKVWVAPEHTHGCLLGYCA